VTGMTLRLRRATAADAADAADAVLASTRIPDLSPGQRITLALDALLASAQSAPAFSPGDARAPRYIVDVVRPDGSVMCSLAVEATSREISQ
jgi:hypothetical protein